MSRRGEVALAMTSSPTRYCGLLRSAATAPFLGGDQGCPLSGGERPVAAVTRPGHRADATALRRSAVGRAT